MSQKNIPKITLKDESTSFLRNRSSEEPRVSSYLSPRSGKTYRIIGYSFLGMFILSLITYLLPEKLHLTLWVLVTGSCLLGWVHEWGYRLKNGQEMMYEQLESYIWLTRHFDIQYPHHAMRGWVVSPDAQRHICGLLMCQKPSLVVELGSGVSTIFNGKVLEENGHGRLVALDNSEEYAAKTGHQILNNGLSNICTVNFSPPKSYTINGKPYEWYSFSEDIFQRNSIDVLFVDGPAGPLNSDVRYPAVPLLYDYLADESWIILDDAGREKEREIIRQWLEEFHFSEVKYFGMEKGLCVMKLIKK